MAIARFAWGIDIGNRALKAVKLVPDGDGYRVDDFHLVEHETVLSNAGDNRDTLIQSAIANFVQRHPPERGGTYAIGVSGQQSFARFIKLPPVEESKIPEIVRFEAIQQIPFPLDDVEWSYQLFQQADAPDVEVGIFAMRKDLLRHHIAFFTDVDMNVGLVQMNPLAVYNAMAYDGRIDGTTLIVDTGAENTDLIIADGDSVWLRSIPIGGNNFTETLSKSFKVPPAKGEDLKRNVATSKYQRQIFQAMRPVFDDLVGEIQRSIGFYSSVHRESRIARIIALGGTFRLPTLQKYVQQKLQLPVERVDRLGASAPAEAKLAAQFNENLLSSVGAYGLALQALGQGKIVSSLLPTEIRRAQIWQDKTKWFGLAAACFLLGTGIKMGSVYLGQLKLDSDTADKGTIANTQSQAKQLDDDWGGIEQSGSADRQTIANVVALTKYRTLWSALLDDIHSAALSCNPQPALLSGDVDQIKAIPRGTRNQIFIDSITSAYQPSLTSALALPENDFGKLAGASGTSVSVTHAPMGGMPGGGGESSGTAEGPRGFIITVRCTTPNFPNGYQLVNNTLVKALKAVTQDKANPDHDFYIARVTIAGASPVSQRGGSGQGGFSPVSGTTGGGGGGMFRGGGGALGGGGGFGGRGFGGRGPGGGFRGGGFVPGGGSSPPGGMVPGGGSGFAPPNSVTGPGPATPAITDPLTGEDMSTDTDVTIVFAVVLAPPPSTPLTPAAGAQASAAR